MSILKKYYLYFNRPNTTLQSDNNSYALKDNNHTNSPICKFEEFHDSNNNAIIDIPILGDLKSPIYTNNIIETLRNSNLEDINQQKKTLYSLLKKTNPAKDSKKPLDYTIYRSIKHRYRKYDYKNYQFYKDNSKKIISPYNKSLINECEF
jgi:hypothetical protein